MNNCEAALVRPFFCILWNNEKFTFMKKISLLTLAFVSGFGFVNAQNTDPNDAHKPVRTEMAVTPRFGIKGGVNLATMEIDDDSNTNPLNTNNKTSFHGGLFVNIPLGGALRFQPELVYSGQGTKFSEGSGTSTIKGEMDLHYIQVPLMFQLQGNSGLYGELGPQIGFLVKSEMEIGSVTEDIKEDLKKVDFGAGLGIGYLTRIGLGIGARYNMGFSNIYDADQPNDEGKYKNRTLNLGLTYHFGAAK